MARSYLAAGKAVEAMGLLQRTRERISQAEEAWDDLEHPDAQSLKDLQALQKQAVVRNHLCARAHRNPVRVHDKALIEITCADSFRDPHAQCTEAVLHGFASVMELGSCGCGGEHAAEHLSYSFAHEVSVLALWQIAGNDSDLAYNRRGAVWRMRSAPRSASWRSSVRRRAWASWAWTPSTYVAPLIVCSP